MRGPDFGIGMNRGEAFEHYALREPHPKLLLSQEEKRRALSDKEFRRELENRLFGELKLSPEARVQSLKAAVTRYQSPDGVRSPDGKFMHPKTKFAELLRNSFAERLPALFPNLDIQVVVYTAVGSLLDLYGVDGFVRVYLKNPQTGKMVGISDVTIDFSSLEKSSTGSNISAIGGLKVFENEEDLRKFAEDIASVGADLLSVKGEDRAHMTNIKVVAPGFDFDRDDN